MICAAASAKRLLQKTFFVGHVRRVRQRCEKTEGLRNKMYCPEEHTITISISMAPFLMPDYSKMTNVTIHIIDALTAKKKSPSKTPLSVSAQKNIPFPPSHKMETTSSSVDFHARNSFHANKRSFIYRESTRFS